MSPSKRLGMGLDALIGTVEAEPAPAEGNGSAPPASVEIALIRPNPYQPRQEFDEAEVKTLADSVRRQGVLQPVLLRRVGASYQLVAGERRLRAAKMAGLQEIPAVVREIDDKRMLELALVENIQRRDLNPIEKGRAFKQLMQLHAWTQEQVADAVGLGRPTVANFVRILDLPPEIQEAVSRGTLTMGHARALLAVTQRGQMMQLLKRVIDEDLSVRALEQLIARKPGPEAPRLTEIKSKAPYLEELERKLMDKIGVRVEIMPEAIVIPYGSKEQLTLVLKRLGIF